MLKTMCAEANIKGSKTNHSLRATAATQMFQEGVPEKLIQERTGHRLLEGLRSYERLCEPQHKAVSSLLSTNTPGVPGNHGFSVLSSNLHEKQVSVSTSKNPATSINVQDLHGCTININNNTYNYPSHSDISYDEHYVDHLFGQVKDY